MQHAPTEEAVAMGARTFQLNDLESTLCERFPELTGRMGSMVVSDSAIGTERVLFLIEADQFWERERDTEPTRFIREATGVDRLEVHFVPPQFIPRTYSGEIDRRKCLEDWRACQSEVIFTQKQSEEMGIAQELLELFPGISSDRPIQKELNPLGRMCLEGFCEEHGIEFSRDLTLNHIATLKEKPVGPLQSEVFSIVALIDGSRLGFGGPKHFIEDSFLNVISEVVGCPVHFEQICVPPAPILFSDLVFHDYFLSKRPDSAYQAVSSVLRKIKKASLILVDDEDNFRTAPFCAYPILDHQFKMHPDAELLGHRMQRYTQYHHLLPRRVVLGCEITPECISPALRGMEIYLGTPILKMAFHAKYRAYTEKWDFCYHREFTSDADKTMDAAWVAQFRDVLLEFVRRHAGMFRKSAGDQENLFTLLDHPHFCSFLLNRSAVEFVAQQYNSFCIVGFPSSLPYMQRRLRELGKPYFFSSKVNAEDKDYECLILSGGIAKMPAIDKPTFDFMHVRAEGKGGGRPHNTSPEVDTLCPSLAACNESIYRELRKTSGVWIGNYLWNLEPSSTTEYTVSRS